MTMRERAAQAIARMTIDDSSPFAASEALAKRALGLPSGDSERLRFWDSRVPGTRASDDRYRWEISHRRCKGGSHVPPREAWKPLRPEIERDPDELRLSLPLAVADACEYLAVLASEGGDDGAIAARLLAEAEPRFRRDLAVCIVGQNPWSDTFALRSVAARPRALEHMRPVALAIAASYAAVVEDGAVRGQRFPMHERPLVSASAHLAAGLCALGHDLPLLGELLATVRGGQHETGGFGDDMPEAVTAKFGRDNVLTTLVAADLLGSLDPSFDLERVVAWLATTQREDGFFVAFGPELGWLTGEIVRLADVAPRPFAERFRFPQVPSANLDRKTGLPFYAFFDDLARLFAELPGLASATVPVAFLDLAGFGAFNNAFGQDLGDSALAEIARALETIGFARPIRDGGDEFIVVGAPGRTHLERDLDAFRAAWPARFAAAFGKDVPPVAPRILVTDAPGRALRETRERLGRSMGSVKNASKNPPPEGILARV
ncbi:MAG TPA: diguanylate cyclase [Polyangiaceae bacterium]|jgi:GGDEF domain-containing protein